MVETKGGEKRSGDAYNRHQGRYAKASQSMAFFSVNADFIFHPNQVVFCNFELFSLNQDSLPYSSTSGTGGHHQLRYNLQPHYHHSRLVEKAKESPLGNHFRTTVRPKDLPECWGIKYTCDIDLDSIKRELERVGIQWISAEKRICYPAKP